MSPEVSTVPECYDDPVGFILRKFLTVHGKQIGNPEEGVKRIFEAVTGEGGLAGPLSGKVLRLILGSDCLRRVKAWNENWAKEVSLQEESAVSTDFKE